MNNDIFLEKIKGFFGVNYPDNYLELESFTDGDVNMFITLDSNEDKTLFEQFKDQVRYFDVDEEVHYHINDSKYKDHFAISESLNDFKKHKKWLDSIVVKLSE